MCGRLASQRLNRAAFTSNLYGKNKRHFCVVKVELLIFGSALSLIGGRHGLDTGQPVIGGNEDLARSVAQCRPSMFFGGSPT